MKKHVITIDRQCGSGGHTIGKKVAEQLGIPFYDKELAEIVAERSGLSVETVIQQGEYFNPSLLYNLATSVYSAYDVQNRHGMPLQDQINAYQTELIKELANQRSCVIMGRCADYILNGMEDYLRIFISGKLSDRMDRIVREHEVAADAAKDHIRDRDKKRAGCYKHITDQIWGAAENYDLCLNSSSLGIDRCVELICRCCL